jgi:hypothetical protein
MGVDDGAWRFVGLGGQPSPNRQGDDDRLGVDRVEDLVGELRRRRLLAGLAEQHHRRMGDHQSVAQPVLAIGGQARGVEEAHRHQHEADRQQKKSACDADRAAAQRGGRARAKRIVGRVDQRRRRLSGGRLLRRQQGHGRPPDRRE